MRVQSKVSPERIARRVEIERINTEKHAAKRRFLGKINGFIDKAEREAEQRHLRAYFTGKPYYNYGFESIAEGIKPRAVFHEVKQQFYYV